MIINDEYFMNEALKFAMMSSFEGEVPVGCVIAKNNHIIACGRNQREIAQNSLYHAEIIAINNACKLLNRWRLEGCDLYVTLEPCPMCAGAIVNSRINRVIFGANDFKNGCFGSILDLSKMLNNHKVKIKCNVLEKECLNLLQNFFKSLRHNTKKLSF